MFYIILNFMEIFSNNCTNLELTIAMPGFSSSPSLPSSGESGGNVRKELDINQVPDQEEDCMEEEEEESPNGGPARRKKLRLTKEQSRLLEESFRHNQTLNPKEKEALAVELKLKPRQVEVWFQNRRARSKLKQTEMECEYLKRWFGTLTEQNRKLQKELENLRTMKPGPNNAYPAHMAPTLSSTMCPRCERVTTATHVLDKGATTTATTAAMPPFFQARRQPSAACYN
ncbi:hypothetical protein RD792_011386 [Penstemon davidsonii]|uniref:Homeobox domain-containing protein n=1 Tax=Penstemon davidsonii TaxID=160366 RepID=A0ABR0D584_9LAMI|nr:hypothetical protein RD792_011386 [Penstemon davidsonii]